MKTMFLYSILIVLCLTSFNLGHLQACSMTAMVGNGSTMLTNQQSVINGEASWLSGTGAYNTNSWGALYYHQKGYTTHNYQLLPVDGTPSTFDTSDHWWKKWYRIDYSQTPDIAHVASHAYSNSGKIFFAHARKRWTNGSPPYEPDGVFAPFTYHDSVRNLDYSFAHHGSVEKDSMRVVLPGFSDWLIDYDYENGTDYAEDPAGNVDSGYLFLWIVKNIMDNDGDVKLGIVKALNSYNYYSYQYIGHNWAKKRLNILFSDGTGVYAYTNNSDISADPEHIMRYRTDTTGGYKSYLVRSTTNTYMDWNSSNSSSLIYNKLYYLPVEGNIQIYNGVTTYSSSGFNYHDGYNWIGFPALVYNDSSANTNLQSVNYNASQLQTITPGSQSTTTYTYSSQNQSWNYNPSLSSTYGYILQLGTGYSTYHNLILGNIMNDDTSLDFYSGIETWVPYFVSYSQSPADAFGTNWSHVTSIQGEDWYMYKLKGQWYGTYGTMDYGKMYKVIVDQNFSQGWNHFGQEMMQYVPPVPEFFTVVEAPAYQGVAIQSIDSESPVTEVAAYKDGVCVGAAVVDAYPVYLQVYDDSSPESLEYQIVTESKSAGTHYQILGKGVATITDQVISNGSPYFSQITIDGGQTATDILLPQINISIYPNPFHGTTYIQLKSTKETQTKISIYNVKGEKVKDLYDGMLTKGDHSLSWNGTTNSGTKTANGLYFCRIESGTITLTRKLMFLN